MNEIYKTWKIFIESKDYDFDAIDKSSYDIRHTFVNNLLKDFDINHCEENKKYKKTYEDTFNVTN